tara:strand:- start:2085 stop:2270 length:186 start_codon:yes stop_codon:yes gene_type:complete
MAKEKAIEICKNLQRTIKTITTDKDGRHANKTFDKPKTSRARLMTQRLALIKKYNITKEEL